MVESNLYGIDFGAVGSGGTILRMTLTHKVAESWFHRQTCLSVEDPAMVGAFGGRIDGTSPCAVR